MHTTFSCSPAFAWRRGVRTCGLASDRCTPPVADADKSLIGRLVCGEGQFDITEKGARCRACPGFTSGAGSDEGLEIGRMLRGRFTAAAAEGEWILDTDGCEAHFTGFGGAMLLSSALRKPVAATPEAALGYRLIARPSPGSLTLAWYRPGFRLNDCLLFDGEKRRAQLVCNEVGMAQGEAVGHISAMEISRRGINRWRLLRWYDNSGTSQEQVVSVVPTPMRRVEMKDGLAGLQIQVNVLETTRELYEAEPETAGNPVTLEFKRKGQRFFATKQTQEQVERIGRLTRKKLE